MQRSWPAPSATARCASWVRLTQMRLTPIPSRRCGSGRELPTSLNPARSAAASSRGSPVAAGQRHRGGGLPGDGLDIVPAGGEFVGQFGVAQRGQRAMRRAVAAEFANVPEVGKRACGEIAGLAGRPVAHDEGHGREAPSRRGCGTPPRWWRGHRRRSAPHGVPRSTNSGRSQSVKRMKETPASRIAAIWSRKVESADVVKPLRRAVGGVMVHQDDDGHG